MQVSATGSELWGLGYIWGDCGNFKRKREGYMWGNKEIAEEKQKLHRRNRRYSSCPLGKLDSYDMNKRHF